MRRAVTITLLILVLLVVAIQFKGKHGQEKYEKAMCDCQKLKLGMKIDEVKVPIKRISGLSEDGESYKEERFERWSFDIPKGMSDPVECYVDSKSRAIIGYACSDSGSSFRAMDIVKYFGYDSLNNILSNLSSIRSGMSSDCVAGILGPPSNKQVESSGALWIYPKAWLGFQEPRILFDSTGLVADVDIGRDRFVVR